MRWWKDAEDALRPPRPWRARLAGDADRARTDRGGSSSCISRPYPLDGTEYTNTSEENGKRLRAAQNLNEVGKPSKN